MHFLGVLIHINWPLKCCMWKLFFEIPLWSCDILYIKHLLYFLCLKEQQAELFQHQCCPILITYPGLRTTPVSSALTNMSVRKCVGLLWLMTPCMKRKRHSMSFWACLWVVELDQNSQELGLQSSLTKMMVSTNIPEKYSSFQAVEHKAQTSRQKKKKRQCKKYHMHINFTLDFMVWLSFKLAVSNNLSFLI